MRSPATRLFVSPKTIEVITGSIFRRLDLGESSESNRRVQDAVLYVRHAPDLAGATSLPARTTPIIGRRAEHEELQRLLGDHRCLTISGAGGAGKTTLAFLLAAGWASVGNRLRFVDRVEVHRSTAVVDEVIAAFGIVAKDTKVGVRRVRSYIGAGDFLVVLDNADEVAPGVVAVAEDLLTLPGVRIVVTSRTPIWSAHEHVWIAPPMSLYDSEELLRERCPVALDASAMRRICVALDGLPLAIELVASRLASVDADHVLAGLSGAMPDLLVSQRDGRHGSLHKALLPSYDDLPASARYALGVLAVLPGGFTRDIASSLLPGAAAAVDGDLEALTRSSFVTFDGVRYRMLEPIRQFAASVAAEQSHEIAEMHANYWPRWATSVVKGVLTPDPARWYESLKTEHPNVDAVLKLLLEHELVGPALRIIACLGYPWSVSGQSRALDVALQVLDGSATVASDRWRARALAAIGSMGSLLASPARDWDAMLAEAVTLLENMHDDVPLAAAYYSLSRHRQSLDTIDKAVTVSARTGNRWLHGWALVNKASMLTVTARTPTR